MSRKSEIEIKKRQLMKYPKSMLLKALLGEKGINAVGFLKEDIAELIAIKEFERTKDHFAKISGRL